MKKIVLILFALASGIFLKAQTLNYEWAKSIGASKTDQGNSVITDKSGNVYTTGFFSGKTDFDPGKDTAYLTSNGGYDIYISKLDANGKFVWAVKIGDAYDDAGNSINLDKSGNIYVTGYFMDKVDFDPGSGTAFITSSGDADIFVCKFDDAGKYVWASKMGGKGFDAGNGIDLDASGNVYTTGYFNDTADFNPSSTAAFNQISFGASDIYISALDNKGAFLWAGQMGGADEDQGTGIALDSLGYVFTTGYFIGQGDFDPSSKSSVYLNSVGDADIFVSKVDIKGVYTWAHPAGDKAFDAGTSIAVDAFGNNYTTGLYYGAPDFDPGTGKGQVFNLTSNGDYDIFVWKLDAGGNFAWAKTMGGGDFDMGLSIAIDNAKNIYTTGVFSDVADFDPGSSSNTLTSAGDYDIFISKLDGSGNYDWALRVGNADGDMGISIAVDKSKTVYTTGIYFSTVDFNPGSGKDTLTSVGDADAFILKLSICRASASTINAAACNSYYYNGNTYYQSGDYQKILKNSIGCDSVVTLKLKINTSTIGNLDITACKSYTLNGQTYTTAGSYTQTLTNYYGCDSFLVLNLTFANNASSISAKACNSYILNSQTYTTSGTYTQTIKNKAGCDSVITLKLTILKSTSSTVAITACNSYTLETQTYTTSGTYIQTIRNNADCDSVITLKLTINNTTSNTIDAIACSSYTLNTQTYTLSGTYKQTIPNKKGCDSLITLNLSINNTVGELTTTACKSFTLAAKTYTTSGVYTQIIPNAKGCDSTITLNLTINNVINTVTNIGGTLTSDAIGATYQWQDCNKGNMDIPGEIYQSFTPTKTGDYTVKVTKNNCTDNSNCINVKVGKIENTLANNLQVFPNPTNGETYLILGNSLNNGTLKLISFTGQTLQELTNLSGNKFSINLTEQAKGIYFIEISEDGKVSRVKLVKN